MDKVRGEVTPEGHATSEVSSFAKNRGFGNNASRAFPSPPHLDARASPASLAMPARGKADTVGGKKPAAKKTPVKKTAVTKKSSTPVAKSSGGGGSGGPWDDEMASIPANAVYIEACKS